MIYPWYDEKGINELIENLKKPASHSTYFTNRYGNKTFEEIVQYQLDLAVEDKDKRLENSLNVYRDNSDFLTKDSLEVINKLLGDRKLRNKIRIIADGSWYMNRIFGFVDTEDHSIVIRPEICGYAMGIDTDFFKKLSPKKQIDWIYNHFDYIFLQLRFVECRSDFYCITEDALFDDMLDRFD